MEQDRERYEARQQLAQRPGAREDAPRRRPPHALVVQGSSCTSAAAAAMLLLLLLKHGMPLCQPVRLLHGRKRLSDPTTCFENGTARCCARGNSL